MEEEQALAQGALESFDARLDALDTALRPVLDAMDELRSGVGEELPTLMRARVDATLAYALNAIFCMYLRTQGQDPTEHPVREEIARVRAAYVRIHEIDAGKVSRPRKRIQAAVFSAEQELSRVLTDGERALHLAANGKTAPSRDVCVTKPFGESSDESGRDGSPDADSTDKKMKSLSKSTRKKRKLGSGDTGTKSPAETDDEEDVRGDLGPAKTKEVRRKHDKKDRKEQKKERKETKGDRRRRRSQADIP